VIRFNMRGEGLSDPVAPRDWQTLEQRAEDMQAVLDAVGSQRTALLGGAFGGQMMTFFGATHPERTAALVLVGTTARLGWAPDSRWGLSAEEQASRGSKAEEGWEGRRPRPSHLVCVCDPRRRSRLGHRDPSGLAHRRGRSRRGVHIGARVAASARAGEVLVSGAVPPLVAGSGICFGDRGERELKGIPGTWRLYAVEGT
jgi:pimeloyl-ACP methyl ester carboxylesterase